MSPIRYFCPYCGQYASITTENHNQFESPFVLGNKYDHQLFILSVTSCPNPECREYSLRATLHDVWYDKPPAGGPPRYALTPHTNAAKQEWQLKPQSTARVFPEYIPTPIRSDYQEACTIKELSPKASATLSRRCLQGMIHDFWGITKTNLKLEIDALEVKIDGELWKAIDAVRKLGNIGAHMEKDTSMIIDVDPEEAGLMINLIEDLIQEWYVARHDREERVQKLIEASTKKEIQKKGEK